MIDKDKLAETVAEIVSGYKLPEQPAGLYRPVEYALDCGGCCWLYARLLGGTSKKPAPQPWA